MASMRRYDVKQTNGDKDDRSLTRYRQVLAAELPDFCPDTEDKAESPVKLLSIRHSGVLDSLLFNSLEESCVDSFDELHKRESKKMTSSNENIKSAITDTTASGLAADATPMNGLENNAPGENAPESEDDVTSSQRRNEGTDLSDPLGAKQSDEVSAVDESPIPAVQPENDLSTDQKCNSGELEVSEAKIKANTGADPPLETSTPVDRSRESTPPSPPDQHISKQDTPPPAPSIQQTSSEEIAEEAYDTNGDLPAGTKLTGDSQVSDNIESLPVQEEIIYPQESTRENINCALSFLPDSAAMSLESPTSPISPPPPLMSPTSAERREEYMTAVRPVSYVLDDSGKLDAPASPNDSSYRLQSCNMPFNRSPLTLKIPKSGKSQPSSPNTSLTTVQVHSPDESFDSAIAVARSHRSSIDSGTSSDPKSVPGHFVVVAIDFGTAFSGYAFSFTRDPDSIHMMRKWEGGDPGVINQKTPTTLLLTPDGKFHMFGFNARDFFHDLEPQESKKWLYFEKFKMTLHNHAELNKDTMIKASNGKLVPVLTVFTHALRFFKDHALQELSDQSMTKILNEDVRWVITVPAIWKAPAKQFMRQAAYQAGIASAEYPDQLLIALEPEAASIYCRKLRLYQLVPEIPDKRATLPAFRKSQHFEVISPEKSASQEEIHIATPDGHVRQDYSVGYNCDTVGSSVDVPGTRYMVVDCGGGTVDITVHEIETKKGSLMELHIATGGPYGSVGVDMEFEKLLISIFGADFIEQFKYKRPAGYVDLMIAFESRKRAACAHKYNPLNVSLPFSFIDYYKKLKGTQVESAIRKFGDKEVKWSSQGMLRLSHDAMRRLFLPTVERIKNVIGDVLNNPECRDVKYMFLVGGFSESSILQYEIRKEFGHILKVIIPQDVGLTILKGAVMFGLDPTVVNVRKSRLTYGVGVLNRFTKGKHPKEKLVKRDGVEWCTDVFDHFVGTNQSVALGDTVLRSYTPAKPGQKTSVINIYCSENPSVQFITDPGVKKCGTLCLDLSDFAYQSNQDRRREIQMRMIFGDTEIKVTALDVSTGKCVKAAIDFLNK